MLHLSVKGKVDYRGVMARIKRKEIKSLSHAAGALRLAAIRSIKQSPKASAPGQPPHTRKGLLRKSILYSLLEEKGMQAAVIGPSFDLIGLAGKAHEFGGHFREADYPARPYMGPALSVIANRLPSFFSGNVRET